MGEWGRGTPRVVMTGCRGKEGPGLPPQQCGVREGCRGRKVGLPRGPQGALLASAEASTTSPSQRAPPTLRGVPSAPREVTAAGRAPARCFQLQIPSVRAPVSVGSEAELEIALP